MYIYKVWIHYLKSGETQESLQGPRRPCKIPRLRTIAYCRHGGKHLQAADFFGKWSMRHDSWYRDAKHKCGVENTNLEISLPRKSGDMAECANSGWLFKWKEVARILCREVKDYTLSCNTPIQYKRRNPHLWDITCLAATCSRRDRGSISKQLITSGCHRMRTSAVCLIRMCCFKHDPLFFIPFTLIKRRMQPMSHQQDENSEG